MIYERFIKLGDGTIVRKRDVQTELAAWGARTLTVDFPRYKMGAEWLHAD